MSLKIWNWRNDSNDTASKIIDLLHKDLESISKKLSISKNLTSILDILNEGNEATQFLNLHKKNKSIRETVKHFIEQFTIMDFKSHDMIKSAIKLSS